MPQSLVFVLTIGLVIALTFVSIFAWVWAIRRPVPLPSEEIEDAEGAREEGKGDEEVNTVPRPFVYAAIGASDVEGIGALDPGSESWVSIIAQRMPLGTQLIRLGRGGITLNDANKVEIPAAVAAQPDLVTMWNCVNDAARGVPLALYTRDLKSALDRLTGDTEAHVVLLNLPDLSVLLRGVDEVQRPLVQGGIRQWNKAIADIAAPYGDRITQVDLFPVSAQVLAHPELVSTDNFHPSSEGYRWLADHVWEVIQREKLLDRAG